MAKIRLDSRQRTQMRDAAVDLFNNVLDVLYPPRCVHCKQPGSAFCKRCLSSILPAPPLDYKPLAESESNPLDGALATGLFEGALQSALHGLKYERKQHLARPLADRLANSLRQPGWLSDVTAITAVPLHSHRLRERGYNQAAVLAGRLASIVDVPFIPNLLVRTRDTQSQVGLNYAERQLNLIDAFAADPTARDQSIVLIDDVYTTGATLRQCAAALRSAGAAHIWALTVAATPFATSRSKTSL